MKNEKRNRKLPAVGQRIVRSSIAVALCFVLYYIRGKQGIPFYSALAVLQCIQPYNFNMKEMAKKRTIGTFVGAFWGTIVIFLLFALQGSLHAEIEESFAKYMLISLFTGIVLYSTVVLNCKKSSYFSCVVFLSITTMHITDPNPILFVGNRVLDTLIGIGLAIIVNSVHLPRQKNNDILFVSGIDDTLLTSREDLTAYSKVELNRIIDTGAKFTVSTIRTPASVREALDGIRLKLPIIAMDGAVLYDMNENSYLMKYQMSTSQAKVMTDFLDKEGFTYFTNTITEDLLVIYYQDLKKMLEQDWKKDYKIVLADSINYLGYAHIKIYHKDATREHMLLNLKALLNIEKTVTFGSVEGKYDVIIADSDKNVMVKELKRLYEPVRI